MYYDKCNEKNYRIIVSNQHNNKDGHRTTQRIITFSGPEFGVLILQGAAVRDYTFQPDSLKDWEVFF